MANQDKFTLTKLSFHIEFHKELSIIFCESLLSWSRMFADSASVMVSIPTFDNGFETTQII